MFLRPVYTHLILKERDLHGGICYTAPYTLYCTSHLARPRARSCAGRGLRLLVPRVRRAATPERLVRNTRDTAQSFPIAMYYMHMCMCMCDLCSCACSGMRANFPCAGPHATHRFSGGHSVETPGRRHHSEGACPPAHGTRLTRARSTARCCTACTAPCSARARSAALRSRRRRRSSPRSCSLGCPRRARRPRTPA